VWLAPQAVRDQRELLRYRMALVQTQTMTKNRIHATLHRHGILHGFGDLFCKKGLAFLCDLVEAEEPLRASTRQTLGGYLKLLEQVRGQIAQATRILRKEVQGSVAAELWRSLLEERDGQFEVHRDLERDSPALLSVEDGEYSERRRWRGVFTCLAREARLICTTHPANSGEGRNG